MIPFFSDSSYLLGVIGQEMLVSLPSPGSRIFCCCMSKDSRGSILKEKKKNDNGVSSRDDQGWAICD